MKCLHKSDENRVGSTSYISVGSTSTNSTNHKLKTIFSICSWESQEHRLYALYYNILYKGTENLWILVSAVFLEPIPPTD